MWNIFTIIVIAIYVALFIQTYSALLGAGLIGSIKVLYTQKTVFG